MKYHKLGKVDLVMNEILDLLWELFIDITESFLLLYLLNSKLHIKWQNKKAASLCFIIVSTVFTFVTNSINVDIYIAVPCLLILNIVLTFVIYSSKISHIFFWNVTYTIISILADICCLGIPSIFLQIPTSKLLLGGQFRYPGTIMYLLLLAIPIIIFCTFPKNTLFLNWTEKIWFALLSTTYILLGEYILATAISFQSNNVNIANQFYLFCLIYLLTYIILFFYICKLSKSRQENFSLLSKQKIHELEKNNLDNYIESAKQLRYMKHDMNINLNTIKQLIEAKKYADLEQFVADYIGSINQSNIYINTGNIAVDCVLSTYMQKLRAKNIFFEYSVHLPDNFIMDNIPLSSLLGNLCENALEACGHIDTETSEIVPKFEFIIKPFKESITIHASNTYDGKLIIKDGKYFTTKTDKESHGFGLKRIHDIVDSHSGIMKINTTDCVFTVDIVIPLFDSIK